MKELFIKAGSKRSGWRTLASLIKLILAALLSTAALTTSVQATQAHWRTLVSLTFDDGLTESAARNILASHGMQGTFYVNSSLIGAGGGYLTKAELDAIYADGNEIGGHTTTHPNLATLSDAQQQAAICDDMQTLLNWGYPIHSFAYPYASTGPTTQSIVAAGCPGVGTYESARAVGGLVTGTACYDCPWAETVPPNNRYYIATNASVSSTTTLDDLKGYVTQAENNGGGWVPLVFHRVCDGCNTLAISPAMLDAFLTWLETRESQYTYVRTVHEVLSGDYPPPPPPPTLGPNLLRNPSLEIDADNNNQGDCWLHSTYGSNSAIWTHLNDPLNAHSGNFSERLNVSSFSSGDIKLVSTMDAGQAAGGCAANVLDGERYQLSAWYKSNVPAGVVLFNLDANGIWRYWRDGPSLPPTANWAQMIYYPGLFPAGTQAVSYGIALSSVGTLTTDDYSMAQVQDTPPPADTTPPVITGFAPANGSSVSATVPLTATVTDNVAVQRVEFRINGTLVATDFNSPYAVSWNSKSVANGPVIYSIRAVDAAGNEAVPAISTLTVNNDVSPPSVSFNQPPTPAAGTTVSGQVSLAASAADDVGVTRVDFLVNGSVVGSATAAPYQATWNSLLTADGAANLTAMAYDAAGNSTATAAVNVTVSNQAGHLLTNPSLEIDANNNGIADCWQRSGYGTNAYTWTRLSGASQAHSGNFAESLQMTSRTSGDRKLVQTQDASSCAPTVTAGARYTLSGWYKSTVATGLIIYYRTSGGVWTYWQTSANFAAAANWTKATYTTPPIPAGATALSFGFYLSNVGTLITDDYAMTPLTSP